MQLVIAEKPSVAQSIASVLGARTKHNGYQEGNGYVVSWCFGHLAGLADADVYDQKYAKWKEEDLPIIPELFEFRVGADKKEQYELLKQLMHRSDVTEVINACDAGREGELIFRTVYYLAECQKPMKRLWISSMEDEAIREGFLNLKDGAEYDGLYHQCNPVVLSAVWYKAEHRSRNLSHAGPGCPTGVRNFCLCSGALLHGEASHGL